MRKEELEMKLREKVLASLGLSEEELRQIPTDKITEIEKMIEELMERAMTEGGQDKARERKEKGQAYVPVIPGTVT